MANDSQKFETVLPSEADALLAGESIRQLATHKLDNRQSVRIQLLDEDSGTVTVTVPSSVGVNQIVRLDDLLAFKGKDDEAKLKIADQLTADAQELGMGY